MLELDADETAPWLNRDAETVDEFPDGRPPLGVMPDGPLRPIGGSTCTTRTS
jgi:hypothetical protein